VNKSKKNLFHRVRDNAERGFARWGEICYDRPWWIIAAVLSAVVFFSMWLPTMVVDTSNESYLREDDPNRQVYDQFQREFGKDERIVVLVESRGDLVNDDFLRQLQTLHERLVALPQVDSVDSLVNARLTIGKDDELIVKDLLKDWPQNAAEFAALRERIRNNPLYRDNFVNADLTKTMIFVMPDTYTAAYSGANDTENLDEFDFSAGFDGVDELLDTGAVNQGAGGDAASADEADFLSDQEIYKIIGGIQAIGADLARDDFRVSVSGSPFMMYALAYQMGRDMFLFSAIGILLISVLLFAIFRRWVMVILPVLVSALSVYFTITLVCFIGMVVTTSVQILPSLLLAIGVGNAVHLFTVYFQAVDRGNDKRQALSYAMGHSGLAVLMTGLTTAGGLVSFVTANLQPVADIGIICPIGILSTLVFSLVLLPALIAVTPFKDKGLRDDSKGPFQRFLMWCADVSTGHPVKVVSLWAVVIVACLFMVAQIRSSHFPLNWFPEDSEVRYGTNMIDKEFGGATFTEIVVDTGKENGLHDPKLLHSVDRAIKFIDQLEVHGLKAGKSVSLLAINKELHQALHGNDPEYYRIPDDRALIAQELLLFENSGSDDLEDIVDSSFSKMRITVKMPAVDGTLYPDYLDALTQGFGEIIGDQAELTYTGVVTILAGSVRVLISDTIRAYLLAFLIITPLMMLLVGSFRTGIISMIPNLAPIIITMALMPILNIPLDAFTLLLGSIALGLAVDDTIHFMHNFQRYYSQMQDSAAAVRETLRTTGKAMMITSVVLSCSFFVNLAGTMHNLQDFGLLTGICIIMAFLADVLLAPALMTLLMRWKESQNQLATDV